MNIQDILFQLQTGMMPQEFAMKVWLAISPRRGKCPFCGSEVKTNDRGDMYCEKKELRNIEDYDLVNKTGPCFGTGTPTVQTIGVL